MPPANARVTVWPHSTTTAAITTSATTSAAAVSPAHSPNRTAAIAPTHSGRIRTGRTDCTRSAIPTPISSTAIQLT